VLFLPRMAALLLSLVGALGLTLAVIGLYGVVSYNVARRTREMGIRMALGATPHRRDPAGHALRPRLAGVGAAVGLALAARVDALRAELPGRRLMGGPGHVHHGVPALLVAVAALAAFVPARRAGRIGPLRALRPQ
jgi:putative ABC transport system permease protein